MSSQERRFPDAAEAKPHCVLMARFSIGTYLEACSIRRNNSSSDSSCGSLVVISPSTTVFPFGTKRRGSKPPARSVSNSNKYLSIFSALKALSATRIVKRRIGRRVELNIGSAFVDQRLYFVAHNSCEILKHVVNRRIKLVGYAWPVPAHGVLHRSGRAYFERSRRMLFQKRSLAWSEASFFSQFGADDKLQ